MTSLFTVVPRALEMVSMLELTAMVVRVTPSTQAVDTWAGRPSDALGVIGVPSALRNSGQLDDEKPRAWSISWTVVASCPSQSAVAELTEAGQKLMWPNIGRSYWSRWQVEA